MQDDLSILRVVLVPGIVKCVPCSGDRNRRRQLKRIALLIEETGERPMVVAGSFEGYLARCPRSFDRGRELLPSRAGVCYPHPPATTVWVFDQNVVKELSDIDCHERRRGRTVYVHSWNLLLCFVAKTDSRKANIQLWLSPFARYYGAEFTGQA